MLTPLAISLSFVAVLLALVLVLRARDRRRRKDRHMRRVQRRGYQHAWDIIMRRPRHQRLTDQRHLTD